MTVAPTRGRAGYAGFRATIKAVATGPRGSRDLTFDEARDATAALLDGEVSPAQAGAFLIGMRVKGEAAEELAGVAQALRDRCAALRPSPGAAPPLASAGAFDGVADAPVLSLAASVCAAAAGAPTVTACGTRLGPKHGVTAAEVLAALGGPARPTPEQSERMLARSGVALVHVGAALPGWEELAALRDEVGLRGPIHSAEKLVDWFGARRFVVGHTHGAYAMVRGPRHAVLVGLYCRPLAARPEPLPFIARGPDIARALRSLDSELRLRLAIPQGSRLGKVEGSPPVMQLTALRPVDDGRYDVIGGPIFLVAEA